MLERSFATWRHGCVTIYGVITLQGTRIIPDISFRHVDGVEMSSPSCPSLPRLAARAKLFGNRLKFKQHVKCVDAPYFDAPGTLEAPLGCKALQHSSNLELAAARGEVEAAMPLLPPVTMVFFALDGTAKDALRACGQSVVRTVPITGPGGSDAAVPSHVQQPGGTLVTRYLYLLQGLTYATSIQCYLPRQACRTTEGCTCCCACVSMRNVLP